MNIPGDYNDYEIFEEEKETKSSHDEVLVKTREDMWRGRLMINPYCKKRGQQKYENKTENH